MVPAELKNFTGIDSPCEVPKSPALRIDPVRLTAQQAAAETAPGEAGPA